MNTFERVRILAFDSKIATVVSLFKFDLPYAKSDLKHSYSNLKILNLLGKNPLNIGFHFPGVIKSWCSHSILLQIYLYQYPYTKLEHKAIGVKLAGFNPTIGGTMATLHH